ncbi:MAG: DSBA oxidoreductase [Candidatus Collierbacteria bacterium GW2011_GWB1_45_35]|uniref:DSBA oxidoreductase n=2 Tax=Candidatus Collieribacteriota TaxID=1752725 RepID=A0A0G1KPQ8_9BACT|nr:MAG: DSBA oxidoreductase [Microgenomates group bacterium GW2011_GWC1_44_23]KKT85470.1 MAG: DSBA oxidoreductase [Candidatus Collierbacteria bacterium GW2011_GWA2_44_99]KKT94765.1 MAG: DSBA oxidoreductase [Candidatus Collierbacteria bacterium GW2011_GWA1_45_15]KKT99385.1 MAG: DSBA oxidoreductase [Candidatus Collierbacteria bacterium GW2011_GWB2_45_17]KKU04875.1 MAG: DSBA oxidoreductase [Candidatus Collierbacteria bacterium GW2011_GWB1_45_35]KKU07517.1 MAG: DSBA oxidoreductase [Candidatus Coll
MAAFFLGSLWTEVKYLKKTNGQQATGAAPTQQVPSQPDTTDNGAPIKVSVDNDPVLGDKKAIVTLIEFSDYECPFCKKYFTDTYPQIKKDYIDTGKVKMVFRDLPLGFHQNAPKEAEAAECARKQGGDTTYFKYHDQIFTKTTSNGTGLALDQLPIIAKELGLNVNKFQQCLDSGEFKSEVDKDLADAGAVGANGTPTFFIGKSTSNGEVDGIKVVGAQPYSAFKTIIDELLK